MRFLRAADYAEALAARIPKARKRVVINAAGFLWGDKVSLFIPLLKDAAARGIEVRVVADMYSKFVARAPHPNRGQDAMYSWSKITTINNELRQAGAHISYTGRLGLNPFSRRMHSKITSLDDTIFTLGGVNFFDDMYSNHDYMLHMRDPILADRLYRLIRDIEKNRPGPLPDLDEQLGGTATLLFDGGTPGKSVIYDTACKTVATAQKVYFVSQMCPSGRLAKLLNATNNECYFIRPKQADPPANIALAFDQWRFRIKNRYTAPRYIHAKFILTEDKNGSKHIISGSNNFSWRGVAYGTKEIAVHSTDAGLWQQFYEFLEQDIRGIRQ